VANQLLAAAEQWALERGFSHLGSDARLDNLVSHSWHRAAGFAEVERIVAFAKPLARNSK
jgi:aminoglycoside 6'-N-acetyltransferase I